MNLMLIRLSDTKYLFFQQQQKFTKYNELDTVKKKRNNLSLLNNILFYF
jgi:hypothetical protein